ncbi:hypothetical protein LSCM1_01273 [Leishmania martiniquensis]|uniref:Uncharacterized protein n=1 Tax=Leishmania martiniquensis TaxID=1580590 RepID=A0A836KCB3_9TRYP|nr:hypothetical protein LSCM1_01273 [Leishmania martiniquensis]
MERNPVHPSDPAAKLPVRQKEVKFDSLCVNADDRFAEGMPSKSEERRGFRPNMKVYAANAARIRGRAGGASEVGFTESVPVLHEVFGEEKISHIGRTRARQLRASEGNADALSIARVKSKGSTARPVYAAPTAIPSTRSLWVEGSSVLNQDVGLASAALTHLSDCVTQERRLKAEWEAARLAKIRALRAVVKVFMQSFIDQGSCARSTSICGKALSDTLAVARCSVITNALVGTVQNFMRALRSRRLCASRGPASEPPMLPSVVRPESDPFTMSLYSSAPGQAVASVDDSYASPGHSVSDCLEEEEVSRIKQLYFDYFDCEALSISSAVASGSDMSILACGATPSASLPSSPASKGERSSFSQRASNTM